MKPRNLVLLLLLLFGALPAVGHGAEIRLSVAASMTDAVKELAAAYRRENPQVVILPNFGSSGALAKQIAQGAPADLYISANGKWVDYLVGEGKVAAPSVGVLACNALVFIGAKRQPLASLAALRSLARLAIGSPKSVPAGQYAEQAMRAAGVYEALLGQNKLVMAKDVRQALLYADRGEVDGAFVYKTDALLARQAVILYAVPEGLHDRIAYPMALTVAGEKNPAAAAFAAFLKSGTALAILEKYGFTPPQAAATEPR